MTNSPSLPEILAWVAVELLGWEQAAMCYQPDHPLFMKVHWLPKGFHERLMQSHSLEYLLTGNGYLESYKAALAKSYVIEVLSKSYVIEVLSFTDAIHDSQVHTVTIRLNGRGTKYTESGSSKPETFYRALYAAMKGAE